MRYIKRNIEKFVLKTNKTFKVVFLGGPRQVGKTTLLKKISKKTGHSYVSLDNLNQRDLAKADPIRFIQQLKLPAIIDEIQYAPELLSVIKERVDQTSKNGLFWITGSQQFNLIRGMQESLAGRVAILDLLGLSQKEKSNLKSIFEEIFQGSFPVFQSNKEIDRETFFNSYIQTYLDRDLSDIFNISKLLEFNRFLQICAARTGQIVNISDMARDADIPVSTAREWLSVLETTKQIYLLKPYFANITKRIIKASKLYFLDTGLACYLTKWDSPNNLRTGAMAGAIYETYVVGEIIKKYINQGKQPPIYYLRDKEGHEVDLVIEDNGLHLYEIKLSASIKSEHSINLDYYFKKSDKFKSKTIISLIDKELITSGGVKYIPYTSI